MEVDDSFFLTKKNFPETTSSLIRNLLTDEDFTDVTLASSDNIQMKAHRVVLSGSSKFFNSLLKVNKGPNLVLYLKGVNHQDLRSLMEFMYSGQTKVQKNSLNSFLEAAEELKIEGLVPRKPLATLEQEVNSSTISEQSQTSYQEPSSLSSLGSLAEVDTDFSSLSEEAEKTELSSTISELTMEEVESSVSSLLGSVSEGEDLTFSVTPEFGSTLLPTSTPAQKAGQHKCEDCEKTFTAAWSVRRHQLTAHSKGKKEVEAAEEQKPRVFSCDHCEFSTLHKTSLKRHLLMVHKVETTPKPESSKEKKFGCEHCQFRTSHETSLKRHVKNIHEKSLPLQDPTSVLTEPVS